LLSSLVLDQAREELVDAAQSRAQPVELGRPWATGVLHQIFPDATFFFTWL
jgi:hypothetical protein